MVLEITTIHVHRGSRLNFDQALPRAIEIIAGADGYIRHQVHRSVENRNHFVLLVFWQEKADSVERFRESGRLGQIQSLLHGFYEIYPKTEFFSLVDTLPEVAPLVFEQAAMPLKTEQVESKIDIQEVCKPR